MKIKGNVGLARHYTVRGTGKSQATSPSHTHKPGGAIYAGRKAKGPLDNRGPRGTGHRGCK
jgi:hypothetical protein